MDISWNDTRLFLAIAETGSLSAAARRLELGQPTVSRRLLALEEAVGYPIFQRSVEGASLTSAGEKLLEPAMRMAEWAAEFERTASQADTALRGLVRVTAPPGLAVDFLAPFAGAFRKTHPEIDLQILSSIRYVDLVRREADLALRLQRPRQRELVTVASIEVPNAVCATSEYARQLPEAYDAADVDWIAWAPPFENLAPNPQLEARIPGFRPVLASDDFLVQWRAAEAGVGAMLISPLHHRLAPERKLVPLAIDLGLPERSELHLVCASTAQDVPRVRAVARAIELELSSVPDPESAFRTTTARRRG